MSNQFRHFFRNYGKLFITDLFDYTKKIYRDATFDSGLVDKRRLIIY